MCSCPTNSSSVLGRIRSASGRSASLHPPAVPIQTGSLPSHPLTPRLIQNDPCRQRRIQRFHADRWNPHVGRLSTQALADPAPFASHNQRRRLIEIGLRDIQKPARHQSIGFRFCAVSAPRAAGPPSARPPKALETPIRRRAQTLRIVWIHRSFEQRHARRPESFCGSQYSTGVPRVLDSIQHHHQGLSSKKLLQCPRRRPHQGDHSLAGLGSRHGIEQLSGNVTTRVCFSPTTCRFTADETLSAAKIVGTAQSLRSASSSR